MGHQMTLFIKFCCINEIAVLTISHHHLVSLSCPSNEIFVTNEAKDSVHDVWCIGIDHNDIHNWIFVTRVTFRLSNLLLTSWTHFSLMSYSKNPIKDNLTNFYQKKFSSHFESFVIYKKAMLLIGKETCAKFKLIIA